MNEFIIRKGFISNADSTIYSSISGSTVLDVQGTLGQLFSVTDNLTGDIFSVSDISGIPIFNVNSSGLSTFDDKVLIGGTIGRTESLVVGGDAWAHSFITSGGTTNDFVKGDGTLDSNTYLTAETDSQTLVWTVGSGDLQITNGNTVNLDGRYLLIGNKYTDADARASISETVVGLDYNNTTGVFSTTAGYAIPTTTKQGQWDAGYNDKINSAAFATGTGILTLTQQDAGTVTVDLDGRYLTSATDSQTLTWDEPSNLLTISGGNSVTIDGFEEAFSKNTAFNKNFTTTLGDIKMNGTQSLGVLTTIARADHVHPTDSTRAPLASPTFTGNPTAPTPAIASRYRHLRLQERC
jgi:hypothetical protein